MNGAGPGHQLTPQRLPGLPRPEVVTINPNNGKNNEFIIYIKISNIDPSSLKK